jgi:hypothetical protein
MPAHATRLRLRQRARGVRAPLLVACGCAAACAAAPPPPVEVTLAPLPSGSPAVKSDKHASGDPDSCVLRAKSIARRFEIALTPTGRPFAVVTRARRAELTLSADGSMPLELDAGGVTFAGFATKDETPLFAAKPLSLGGAIAPYGWAELRFGGVEQGGVRLMLERGSLPEVVTGLEEEPSGVSSCDGVSLVPTSFDPIAVLALPGRESAVLAGEPVLVGRRPDEDASLSLWPSAEAPPIVRVLGRTGERARVAWSLPDLVVYGWVDAGHLTPTPKAPSAAPRNPPLKLERTVVAPTHVSCARSVPVTAEVDGEARFIGHVAAGKTMGVLLDEGGATLLGVEGAAFHPSGYSELRVRADDLRGCRQKEAR